MADLTQAGAYVIGTSPFTSEIYRTGSFAILNPTNDVNASARYTITPLHIISKAGSYRIRAATVSVNKSAAYIVVRRPTISKLSKYRLRLRRSQSMQGTYRVAQAIPIVPSLRRFNLLPDLLSDSELPIYFDKDPHKVRGISVTYSGTAARLTILRHRLMTNVVGGPGDDLLIDLQDYQSLQTLANFINSQSGYTCTVDGVASLSPLTLMPVEDIDIQSAAGIFYCFTSLLWTILIVEAWALEDELENIEEGLMESAESTANGLWLDQWGVTFGNVLRGAGEDDPTYRTRIMREVQRIRLNSNAIINAVFEQTGVKIDIYNGQHDLVWVMGDPLGKILSDRPHSQPIIYIIFLSGFDYIAFDAVKAVVERNRMVGIMPAYPPTYDVRLTGSYHVS